MDVEFIRKAYEYHDIQMDKYRKYFNNIVVDELNDSDNDTGQSILKCYDKNNKLIIKSTYQFLGVYKNNIWTWGWAIDISKNINYFIKKIFDYGFNINTLQGKNKIASLLKSLMINSSIIIKNISFLLALSIFLTKGQYIYILSNNNENYYYLLNNIDIL